MSRASPYSAIRKLAGDIHQVTVQCSERSHVGGKEWECMSVRVSMIVCFSVPLCVPGHVRGRGGWR